jgi:hypothetical protein
MFSVNIIYSQQIAHFTYYIKLLVRARVNLVKSFSLALWLNLVYLSKALEFHLPHFFMVASFAMWGLEARALGRAALKDFAL